MTTSLTNVPQLTIPAWANVQASLSILPAQITLPAAPLPNKMNPVVSLINNTTNTLSITEPVVSIPGVEVQLKELQPGKHFSVSLAFPQGFDLKNTPGELTLKSNNPKLPTIKIPILQLQPTTPSPRASAAGAHPKSPITPRVPTATPPAVPVVH
jgi:hypothetical protein